MSILEKYRDIKSGKYQDKFELVEEGSKVLVRLYFKDNYDTSGDVVKFQVWDEFPIEDEDDKRTILNYVHEVNKTKEM